MHLLAYHWNVLSFRLCPTEKEGILTPLLTSLVVMEDKILLQPFNYLRQVPGKEIRTRMIHAFDEWLQVPADKLEIITKVIEMLHTASLL